MHEIINILRADKSYNPSDYRFENPNYHPDTIAYKQWWKEEIKRCVEGYWHEGRYTPPQLYTYINDGVIERLDDSNVTSQKTTQPLLRDIEWLFFYNWFICRKFSGFELDEKYTCNKLILDPKFKRERASKYVLKSNGQYKEYRDPREYLYNKHKDNLGLPLYENNASNLILLTARGCGKLLEPDAKIRKKSGWTTMREVAVGDKVYSSDGTLCNVIAKTPLQVNVKMYEITLRNNKKIRACKDHLWKVYNHYKRKTEILSTEYLYKNYKYIQKNVYYNNKENKEDSKYSIEVNKPLRQETPYDIKLHPYIIGVIMACNCRVHHYLEINGLKDLNVVDKINELLPKEYELATYKEDYSYIFKPKKRSNKRFYSDYPEALRTAKDKRISEKYLYNKEEVRLEVLKGMVDVLGRYHKNKTYTRIFESHKKDMIEELAGSLGINYKTFLKKYPIDINTYKGTKSEVLITNLYTGINLFTVSKYQKDVTKKKLKAHNKGLYSFIENIKPAGKSEGYCISVDSEDNTYITNDYIVTHNSYWGMAASIHEFIFNSNITYEQLITEIKSKSKTKVNCILTCELEDKAIDLINKVKTWYENMPGSYGEDDDYVPSPLYRAYTGSWANKITQQVEKYYYTRDGTKAKRFDGSGSTLGVVTFNKDPYKTAGKRNSVTVVEEIGLCTNLLTFWNANKDVQRIGKTKFGSTLGIGCVCAGTKVWTSKGKLTNIEDLKQEDGILGYDGHSSVTQKINWLKPIALKNCYKITTEGNNTIECSEDHPFIFTNSKLRTQYGQIKNIYKTSYKECKDLKIKDYILVADTVGFFGNTEIEHSYLYGLMLGDGYFKRSNVSIDDNNIHEFITNNYKTTVRKSFVTKANIIYYDLYIKEMRSVFKKEGFLDMIKDKKKLPSNIDTYNKNSLSLILAGIFDSDGNVYENKKKGTRIVLTNISYNLLTDVKHQLLKFGIHSSVYKEKRNTTPQKEYIGQRDHIFRLYISKDIDVKRFIENIPIKHSKKINTLNNFIKGNRDFGTGNCYFLHTQVCEDEKFLEDGMILNGYRLQTIKNIEYIDEKEVYNLNVEGFHNYLANGFITGNTGGDMEKVLSAKRLFENPNIYDCLEFEDTFENSGKKIGLFIPAYLGNNDFKNKNGLTDIEEGFAYHEAERKRLLLNYANSRDIDDEIMNRPLYPSEMFLSKKGNIFPTTELKHCLFELIKDEKRLQAGNKGMLVRCSDCKNGVKFENDIEGKYAYIDSYPIPKEYKKDERYLRSCIRIWEHPAENAPKGLYKIGYDTVHYDHVENPESLISILVYKGNTRFLSDNEGEEYYDMIVAEYTGRYDLLDKNNEIVEMLSRYYNNAEIMMEVNIAINIEYFKRRGLIHLLSNQPSELLDKHIKNRSQNSIVGYIKSPELVPFLEQSVKEWLQKERGMTVEGKIIKTMNMINSKPLLEELIAYNRDDNFDRINALFGIILSYKQDNLDIEDNIYNSENMFMKSIKNKLDYIKKGSNKVRYEY
ncbi:MAG TPA: LAGLIDADG family homing endonuclease [Burkholderiales bacterium]|nr:LAGLIDADG family homing endonuclease [Burkholderiales bacterium]